MLLPSTNSQPSDDRAKIKFLVKWMVLSKNYTDIPESFWKQDASKLQEVKDSKLTCVFIDEQPTLLSDGSITNAIQTIETVAKVNDKHIQQINETTGELSLASYVITRKDDGYYTINESVNIKQAEMFLLEWREVIDLIVIENMFNDKIDYTCNTYQDIIRLNKDMLSTVKNYEVFDGEKQVLQVADKFYENFRRIQEALEKLLLFIRTRGQCYLNDIKQRVNNINNEIKHLQDNYKNVSFA